MVVPIANLSAVVTGMLPDAVVEATRASAAWVMHHLWAWLAVAAAAARSAVEASWPWIETAARLLHGLYVAVLSDAAAWFMNGHRVAVYVTLALVLLAVAFLGGVIWALTCRTMKGPGLGGARVPQAVFKASPKRYYATVRSAKRARRRASGTACWLLHRISGCSSAVPCC